MTAVYLVDLPVDTADPTQSWSQLSTCVLGWLEHRVGLEAVSNGTNEVGTVRVVHRYDEGEAGRLSRWDSYISSSGWEWHTSIWLYQEDARLTVRVRLQVVSRGFRTEELNRPLHRPAVVADVLQTGRIVVDGFQLGRPLRCGAADVQGLRAYLLDPTRTKPVVVVTGRAGNPRASDAAQAMADRLGGLAHVFELDGTESTFALTEVLGDDLAVFDGGVRIFWPGLTLEDSRYAHPLYLRSLFESAGRPAVEARIFRRLATASVLIADVPPIDRLLRQEKAAAERAEIDDRLQELRDLRLASATRDEKVHLDSEWLEEFDKALEAADALKVERDQALYEAEELREELDRLKDDLAIERSNWRALAGAAFVPGQQDGEAPDEVEPVTVLEAVRRAAEECGHLIFLDGAFSSAEESVFPRPEAALDQLQRLDRVAARWQSDDLNGSLRDLFAEEGLSNLRPGISQTAATKYKSDYEHTYLDERIILRNHLATGVGSVNAILRIYWYQDNRNRTFVVGHVGKKLRDDSNR